MLSLSADIARQDIDLQVVNGEGDGGILYGLELQMFAESVARVDDTTLPACRDALLQVAGSDVLVDAAAVAGNFQRMVRIADSTGIPEDGIMSALSGSIPEQLDLHRFASAENTPTRSALQKLLGIPVRFLLRMVARAGKG